MHQKASSLSWFVEFFPRLFVSKNWILCFTGKSLEYTILNSLRCLLLIPTPHWRETIISRLQFVDGVSVLENTCCFLDILPDLMTLFDYLNVHNAFSLNLKLTKCFQIPRKKLDGNVEYIDKKHIYIRMYVWKSAGPAALCRAISIPDNWLVKLATSYGECALAHKS